jgi:hypothetical protein
MAQTLIRGSTQILDASITAAKFVAGLNLASSQLADGTNFLKKDGSVVMTASFNAGGFAISNVGSPATGTDAANKSYVDALVNGVKLHFARLLSITNVALTGLQTIDGVTAADGDIILLTGQTTGSQNGFWTAHSGAWTRPTFWAAASTISEGNYAILDSDGTTYKNTKYFITNTGNIVVDTTVVTFSQDSSGTAYTAGNGISLTGNSFAAKLSNGLTFDGSQNIVVQAQATGLLTSGATGVAITNGSAAGNLIVANGSLNPAWVAASGDVSLASTGAFTVNTTAGSGFLKYGSVVGNETPGGTVNGANTAFTLANTPQSNSLQLYLNGVVLEPGAGNDYTISGAAITALFAPLAGDKLRAYYVK